jgi:hypothetical protein
MALFSLTGRSGNRNNIPMLVRMQRTGGYLHKGMDQPPNRAVMETGCTRSPPPPLVSCNTLIYRPDSDSLKFHAPQSLTSFQSNFLALRARCFDWASIRGNSSGPAACGLHNRPDRWQQPTLYVRTLQETLARRGGVHRWCMEAGERMMEDERRRFGSSGRRPRPCPRKNKEHCKRPHRPR